MGAGGKEETYTDIYVYIIMCIYIYLRGCGTKQPILKRDKTANFQNGTKQPIFKTGQNSRFSKRNKMSAVTADKHGTWFI